MKSIHLIKPRINKKLFILIMGVFLGLGFSVAYASFTDKGTLTGSTFTVASSDVKFLNDLTLGSIPTNLADTKAGPNFTNITSNWMQNYLVKLYNNGTSSLILTTNANYETAKDPDDLRSILFVEPFVWNDNGNGLFEEAELGTSFGKKTFVKWKTEGFNLGNIEQGGIKSFVLRFSTATVSDLKQGKSGLFDFEFGAGTQN